SDRTTAFSTRSTRRENRSGITGRATPPLPSPRSGRTGRSMSAPTTAISMRWSPAPENARRRPVLKVQQKKRKEIAPSSFLLRLADDSTVGVHHPVLLVDFQRDLVPFFNS